MKLPLYLLTLFLLLIGMAGVGYAQTLLNWTFDVGVNNATYVQDNSSYANHGNVSGAYNLSTGGYLDTRGYYFNGTSIAENGSVIRVDDNAVLSVTNDLTLALWVKPINNKNKATVSQQLINKYSYPASQRAYQLAIDSLGGSCSGNLTFILSSVAATFTGKILCSDIPLPLDTWSHVIATFDAGNSMTIYINGVNHTGANVSGALPASIADSTAHLGIGGDANRNTVLNGTIDNVLIFNTSFSAAQALQLYNDYAHIARQDTFYFNSTGGADTNNGSTKDNAYKTISKLNDQTLLPGDKVYFSCDSSFHMPSDEFIVLTNGNTSSKITYGAYGDCGGNKPIFYGSYNLTGKANWTSGSGNIFNATTTSTTEIGFILFNTTLGNISFKYEQLDKHGDYFWNSTTGIFSWYSDLSPGNYSNIEVALDTDVISIENKHDVFIKDLYVKNGAKHGISGASPSRIIIQSIKMENIGGAIQTGTLRYGNGAQFWNNATDILVDNSTFINIFDAPLSNQGTSATAVANNITYSNNRLAFQEYGIEIFNDNPTARATNINITHNVIYNSGVSRTLFNRYGTGYPMCLRLYSSSSSSSISVKDNIFFNCTYVDVELGGGFTYKWNASTTFNNNLYYHGSGTNLIVWKASPYATLAAFKLANGNESNGIEANPTFKSVDKNNVSFLKTWNTSSACGAASDGGDIGLGCEAPEFTDATAVEVLVPINETVDYGNYTKWNTTFTGIDDGNIDTWMVNNSNFFFTKDGIYGILGVNGTLAVGVYQLNVSVNDTGAHRTSVGYQVTVSQGCVPYENMVITTKVTLCSNGTLGDTDANGSIKIMANGILDCNGYSLLGNNTDNSRAISALYSNYTVINCNIDGFEFGIYSFGTGLTNATIYNNHLTNINRGITIRGFSNSEISYNTYATNNSLDATPSGIDFYGIANNILVHDNWIDTGKYGLRVFGNITYSQFYSNNFTNQMVSTGNNIYFYDNTTNNLIHDNIVINSSRNGIGIHSSNNLVYNNDISGFTHHGLDTFKDISIGLHTPQNNTFYNNYIHDSKTTDSGAAGIYLLNSTNMIYDNNTIYNVYNTGLSIEGGQITGDVRVINNDIDTVANCINFYGNNITLINNTLANCDTPLRVFYPTAYEEDYAEIYAEDNYYSGYKTAYLFYNQLVNLTINNSLTVNTYLNMTGIGSAVWLLNTVPKLQVKNTSLWLRSLPTYNDIFYNKSTPSCSDCTNWNQTLKAGERVIELGYVDSTKWIKYLPTTTTELNWTYDAPSKTLFVDCEGTGGFTATFLNNVVGESGFYMVYHNGIYVETADTNDYTANSCSDWEFTSTEHIHEYYATYSNTTTALTKFIKLFSIMAGILVLIVLISGMYFGYLDQDQILTIIWGVLFGAIGLVILLGLLEAIA